MNAPNPYQSPQSSSESELVSNSEGNTNGYSSAYNRAMLMGLMIQGVLGILTLLMLDLGHMHRAFWVSMLCQWATVFLLLVRRPMQPTMLDLAIVRYGIVPLFVIISEFGPIFLRIIGRN